MDFGKKLKKTISLAIATVSAVCFSVSAIPDSAKTVSAAGYTDTYANDAAVLLPGVTTSSEQTISVFTWDGTGITAQDTSHSAKPDMRSMLSVLASVNGTTLDNITAIMDASSLPTDEKYMMYVSDSSLSGTDSNGNRYNVVAWYDAGKIYLTPVTLDTSTNTFLLNGSMYFNEDSGSLYEGMDGLVTVDLDSVNPSVIKNASGMFKDDKALTSVNIFTNNTPNIRYAQLMFSGCIALETLDLSGVSTANMFSNGMIRMFKGCSSLSSIRVGSSFDFVSKTGLEGNYYTSADNTKIMSASYLESTWEVGLTRTITKTSAQASVTNQDEIYEAYGLPYYDSNGDGAMDAVRNNVWKVDNENISTIAYCLDADTYDSSGNANNDAGAAEPYGYYKKTTDASKLVSGLTNYLGDDYEEYTDFPNDYVDNSKGYLNSSNYYTGTSFAGASNLNEALITALFYGGEVYDLSTASGRYNLQQTIWKLTNRWSDSSYALDSAWSKYSYSDIGSDVALTFYESENGTQNLVSLNYMGIVKQTEDSKNLAGAVLTVSGTSTDGTAVNKSFTTATGTKYMTLKPGTYVLKEVQAPSGYAIAGDISFSIDEQYRVVIGGAADSDNVIVMVDKKKNATNTTTNAEPKTTSSNTASSASTKEPEKTQEQNETPAENAYVYVIKQNVDGAKIVGASMQILWYENGQSINTWTTVEDESHALWLAPGKYILREVQAPSGYAKAQDIVFTVTSDKTVTVDGTKKDGNTITMIDEYATTALPYMQTGESDTGSFAAIIGCVLAIVSALLGYKSRVMTIK